VVSELTRDQALRVLTAPAFCVATEMSRRYLCGLFLHHVESGALAAVATDGQRLCRVLFPATTAELTNDRSLIIPAESIKPLAKLLKKSSGPVTLRRSRSLIEAKMDGFVLVSKLLDASYPNYECLVPQPETLPNSATLNRAELVHALERMAAVADDAKTLPLVGLEWGAETSTLKLSLLRQPDAATEVLEADTAGACRIALSLPKMRELLDELKGERVCISFFWLRSVCFSV
jgi:DNA polymerase III subunit beta